MAILLTAYGIDFSMTVSTAYTIYVIALAAIAYQLCYKISTGPGTGLCKEPSLWFTLDCFPFVSCSWSLKLQILTSNVSWVQRLSKL